MWWYNFFGIIVVILALTLFVLGIFTAYFGSGKSRIAGVSLLVVGLVIGLIYILLNLNNKGYITGKIIEPGLLYIGGAIIGLAIGFLIFLAVIMKT